jgi:hypothetical protein
MTELAPELMPVYDVIEACADSLLSAVALLLMLQEVAVSNATARAQAIQMLDRLLLRTETEGPRPRTPDQTV